MYNVLPGPFSSQASRPAQARQRRSPIDIQKGDSIHHPQHGIGRVQSIRERSFSSAPAASYAELYFKRDGLTLTLLEKDLDKTVRNLINSKEAKQLLTDLKEWEGKAHKQWKSRAEANQRAIESGDAFEYAKVFKSLNRLAAKDELRPRDKAHMNLSLDMLTEELCSALGKTQRQVRKMITQAGAV